MKFPLSWLREYLPTKLSPEEIATTLTLIGLEVEGLSQQEMLFTGVVVGKILSTSPHPDAQKLTIAKVTDGTQEYQVVCGAKNCREGIKVAFAKEGAELKDPEGKSFVIKKAKLRGIESEGMLCAHDELGLTSDTYGIENGIMELPISFEEGKDIKEFLSDVIFEVAITPNLYHCANLIGIARELAAITGETISLPKISISENDSQKIESLANVSVEDPEHCPRYTCRMITDVKVGPSPDWLKRRIEQSGMRSVNNVVDATNYVLLERGYPLHPFDFNTLQGKKVIVRNAKEKEKITTLDGKEHFPTLDTLMICDAFSPVAIAGIMGGLSTEVTDKTTHVLLEAAYFEPTQIRRASKRMGIQTEASRRFERGVDPNATMDALNRALSLIIEVAGGKVARGTIDLRFQSFPEKTLSCRLQRINKILGTQLAMTEVETIFKNLNLKIKSSKDETVEVIVPTYRHDLQQEIDLIEEVARFYGYDNIHQNRKPVYYQNSTLPSHPMYLFEKEVCSHLLHEGLQELLTCNLISPIQADLLAKDYMPSRSLIKLLNPSSMDQSILRQSLLPNMLQTVKYNSSYEIHTLAGFEIGRVHFKTKDQYFEPTVAAVVLTGKRSPSTWDTKPIPFDFFDLKGIVENLLEGLKIPHVHFSRSKYENFHPGQQAHILVDNHEVGILGEIHPKTLKKIDLSQPVFYAELNLEDLLRAAKKQVLMSPLPHYPASIRDWTFTLREECPIDEVFQLIQKEQSTMLEETLLLGVYQHEKIGKEWKNVTFRFVYRDSSRTISFKEVEEEHLRLTQNVFKKLQEEKKAHYG